MKVATFLPLVLAATSTVATSLTRSYDVVRARQVKVQRDLLDVCVGLDVDVEIGSIIRDGKPLILGHVDICLCLSLLPNFCLENTIGQAAALLLGQDGAVDLFQNLINTQQNKQSCKLPAHGHSICSFDWPCGFGCDDGYSPYTAPGAGHPSSCYCAPPHTECNGKCGSYPHGCGSAVPAKRYTKRIESKCAAGKTICGVEGGKGWECVDTFNDKESCGGCMAPSPFGDKFVEGVNCKAIAHLASGSVDCLSGSCVVHACVDGFAPSPSRDSCIPVFQAKARDIPLVGAVAGAAANVVVKPLAAVDALVGVDVAVL
ncbi:hypothetical protein EW026_g8203 [Hermanssonia centrifuga]|uniref:Protein CPL1-like domain-containing protein n=1 Tax=Hermanssonia centrifuga TaxID=98765 RepID=A0A4S4K6V3_9APHY|nr:hypothetical protein EW026_g8203 [Hermanssonia centrifuga]